MSKIEKMSVGQLVRFALKMNRDDERLVRAVTRQAVRLDVQINFAQRVKNLASCVDENIASVPD